MSKNCCERCRFSGFFKGLLGGKTHYCYRYPPHPMQEFGLDGKPKMAGFKYVNPQVSADGWCGEFQVHSES